MIRPKGKTQTKDVTQQEAEENILTKREEVTVERRKLHNKELHNLCFLLIIIRVIKLRRVRWA
jgi:hypothetical protein